MAYRVLDLFSGGMGGFSLGLERAGFETAAFCEISPDNRRMLKANWPHVPCYEDVRTITAAQLRADGITRVDAICGGFPCQDASVANVRGQGTAGARTGLFVEVVRLARELGPKFILMENVPGLLSRGFGDVLGCLAESGFDAEWDCIRARHVGADHERDRLWVLAYPRGSGREGSQPYLGALVRAKAALTEHGDAAFRTWRSLVGGQHVLRSCDGLSVGMERRRLFAIGNAIVPQIPELIGRAILAADAERLAA
mgnify:CR=1 FL=1|jgi:Site-specific DNA methylase